MIEVAIQGQLELAERLRFLGLSKADKKKVHGFLGKDLQQAMRKAVRKVVNGSDLKHFDGSASLRKKKAGLFARFVGYKATPDHVELLDRDIHRRGFAGLQNITHMKRGATLAPDARATLAQAARLVALGYLHGKKRRLRLNERQIMRKLQWQQASIAIRMLEDKLPPEERATARRGHKVSQRAGRHSLIAQVWRLKQPEILRRMDPRSVWQRFLRARAAGKA